MTDLSDLVQEQCDFCECTWDDELDDPLVPLHLGDPPQPQPVTARGISGSCLHTRGDQRFRALQNALQEMGGMEYEVHEKVHEVKEIGDKVHFAKPTSGGEMYFDSETKDKTAAKLRFHPDAREVEPDAMVCQECAEMFRSLSDE